MSQIRWEKEDYKRLRKAILQFNKIISKLEKVTNDLKLPEYEKYKVKKKEIVTRQELNRYIKMLERFQKESKQREIILPSGAKITQWEKEEINKARKREEKEIGKKLKELNTPKYGNPYSRAQMGSAKVSTLNARLKRLRNFENKRGYELKSLSRSIFKHGTSDYEERKQKIYKENFLEMLKEFKNYKGYNEFKKMVKNKSPKELYEFINMQEDLVEIQYWYDVKNGTVVPEGLSSEEHFLSILEKYGIKNQIKRKVLKK